MGKWDGCQIIVYMFNNKTKCIISYVDPLLKCSSMPIHPNLDNITLVNRTP